MSILDKKILMQREMYRSSDKFEGHLTAHILDMMARFWNITGTLNCGLNTLHFVSLACS